MGQRGAPRRRTVLPKGLCQMRITQSIGNLEGLNAQVEYSSLYASWTGKCVLMGLNPVGKWEDEWERNPVTVEKDALVGRKRCFLSLLDVKGHLT